MIYSLLATLLVLGIVAYFARNRLRRVQRQAAMMSKVIDTQRVISTVELGEKELMGQIVQQAMKLTGAAGAVIEVVDGEEMVYHHGGGMAEKFNGMRIKRTGSFSGLCVQEGRALLCRDSETDSRVDREACRRVRVRSMIVTPLFHEGRIIAVLKVFSPEIGTFGNEEVGALELIAGLLASALSRAAVKVQLVDARDKAESATRTKSQFLANMSHEIRTPLNGILGMIQLLAETELTPTQREYTGDVAGAAEALLKLVNDILDFSKVEAGKLEFEQIDFDLTSTVQDLSRTFLLSCRKKGIDFQVQIDPRLPAYLKGDPSRLRQILVNLVGNAVKFTSKGFVRVRVLFEKETDTTVSLRFEIEDSGIGIPENILSGLFQEFTQADVSTTRQYGGSGLGLSICKYMIEKMHGQIGAKSEVNRGTTFWFTIDLPRGHREESARTTLGGTIPELNLTGRVRRVLVVDDNTLNQKIAVKSLEKFGIQASVAVNGARALETLKSQAFDLILMDCQMPEMDGYEATGHIRRGERQLAVPPNIPIIAMTANAMKEEAQRCLEAGMDDYISKPFALTAFVEILKKWLTVLDQRESGAV